MNNKVVEKTITQAAEELAAWFESKKRESGESFVFLKDGAPEYLRDAVHAAHGDRLPDDWTYSIFAELLATISGYTLEDCDELEDVRAEIVDGAVDVYTSALTEWLNISVYNVEYIDAAAREYGVPREGGANMLMQAQYMAIDEIFNEVESALKIATDQGEPKEE